MMLPQPRTSTSSSLDPRSSCTRSMATSSPRTMFSRVSRTAPSSGPTVLPPWPTPRPRSLLLPRLPLLPPAPPSSPRPRLAIHPRPARPASRPAPVFRLLSRAQPRLPPLPPQLVLTPPSPMVRLTAPTSLRTTELFLSTTSASVAGPVSNPLALEAPFLDSPTLRPLPSQTAVAPTAAPRACTARTPALLVTKRPTGPLPRA